MQNQEHNNNTVHHTFPATGQTHAHTQHDSVAKHVPKSQFEMLRKYLTPKQWISIFVLLLVVVAGGLAAIVLPKLNLDSRQQASTGTGVVILESAQHNQTFSVGEQVTLTVTANTANLQTDGAQLQFTVSNQNPQGQTIFDPSSLIVTIVGQDSSGTEVLDTLLSLVERTETGVKVTIVGSPISHTASYVTNSAQPLLTLSFVPVNPGQVTVTFDQNNSLVTQKNAQPPVDVLKTVADISVNITPVVVNTAPVAFIIDPAVPHATVSAGTTLTFIGNGVDAQTLPDDGLTYNWKLMSRSGTVATLTGKTVSHTMTLPQSANKARFGMTLTVTDPEGLASTNTADVNIDVITHNSVIIQPKEKKIDAKVGEEFTFIADQSTKDAETYEWTFSDQPGVVTTGKEVTRVLTEPGELVVVLVTKNSDGVADLTPEKRVITVYKSETGEIPVETLDTAVKKDTLAPKKQ